LLVFPYQGSQARAEAAGTGRLQAENERLQREWLEAKAALSREAERAADEARSAAARYHTIDFFLFFL